MGEKRNAYKLLVGKPDEKSPLGSPRRSWVNNIKMDIGEIGWGVLIGLVWLRLGRVESSCECGNGPSGSIEGWEVLEWLHSRLPVK
jgi:hypothetical protein